MNLFMWASFWNKRLPLTNNIFNYVHKLQWIEWSKILMGREIKKIDKGGEEVQLRQWRGRWGVDITYQSGGVINVVNQRGLHFYQAYSTKQGWPHMHVIDKPKHICSYSQPLFWCIKDEAYKIELSSRRVSYYFIFLCWNKGWP